MSSGKDSYNSAFYMWIYPPSISILDVMEDSDMCAVLLIAKVRILLDFSRPVFLYRYQICLGSAAHVVGVGGVENSGYRGQGKERDKPQGSTCNLVLRAPGVHLSSTTRKT